MDIKRYDKMPFYFYPAAKEWISWEDGIISFVDYLADAHEHERNKNDTGKCFYERFSYVAANWFRLQNDTMVNAMYDTQLRRCDYDRLNSACKTGHSWYYFWMSSFHVVSFMYMSYFFRMRRVTLLPTMIISYAYFQYFKLTNAIGYKVFVDRKIMAAARKCGREDVVQPTGSFKPRGFNYN